MTLVDVWSFLQAAGVLGMCLLIGYALHTRRLVQGWVYERQCQETEFWRTTALRSLNAAEKSTDLLQRKGDSL